MLKKIWSALLSLAIAAGLVTALSGPAHATDFRRVDWNISHITERGRQHAQNYWDVIDFIHRNSYGHDSGQAGVRQTTSEQRLIEVRVLDTDNTQLTSVYLWADNLYVAGFYSPASNTHFVFADGRTQEFQQDLGIERARIMPRTGNYSSLPGGNDRQHLVLEPESIYNAMQALRRATEYNDNVGHALLVAIQVFSEAARFGPIFDRVRSNIRDWTHHDLGDGYAGLENQWGQISSFANAVGPRHEQREMTILGRIVRSLADLRTVLGFVELNGGISRF